MRKDRILDDCLVGILTMLRIMFNFSKNVSDADIINRLDIYFEQLRHHFLTSEGLYQLDFILFWCTRYKSDKSSALSDEISLNNNNIPAALNKAIKDEPMTEPMDVKEEATTAIVTSQNVVKYETESNEEVSTCSSRWNL